MLFNSINFLIFFPVVTILYFILPHKYRWIHLLTASCIFYMCFIPQYIFILFTTILIDYIAAIWIEKTEGAKKKKYLIISIISTCLVLFIFKYFDFFNQNIKSITEYFGYRYPVHVAKIILPIGLSFHTFQSLSYVIEVYNSKQKAEKNFGIYSLYVMFYPQLVTGPIERPQNLLVQLRVEKKFEYANLSAGLRLILFGLFIKMVIADNLAVYVDQIYKSPSSYNTYSILTGLLFYSFQIYCDFFGYSSIAVGCAKVMGFNLMDNFKNPYLAKSIGEFWQRWHISLSTWFRDYVYFSLGGNKVRLTKWMINILIVFTISGLWHGANWTFVIWGFAHGFIYIIENRFNHFFKIKDVQKTFSASHLFLALKTFILVSFIWILFRAQNLLQAKELVVSLWQNYHVKDNFTVEPKTWIFLLTFFVIDMLLFNKRVDSWCNNKHFTVRWSLYSLIIFATIVFSNVENYPFIYFQF